MFDKQIFASRLKELREKEYLNQNECAKKLNVSRGSISFYENGERLPDIETIYNMAKFFNVSADYLVGLTDVATTDTDIKAICGYTGLNEVAVNSLHKRFNVLDSKNIEEYSFNSSIVNNEISEEKISGKYRMLMKYFFIFLNKFISSYESLTIASYVYLYCSNRKRLDNSIKDFDINKGEIKSSVIAEFGFQKSCLDLLHKCVEMENDTNADD